MTKPQTTQHEWYQASKCQERCANCGRYRTAWVEDHTCEELQMMQEFKTTRRIRIIVAIDRTGSWQAHGSSNDTTDAKLRDHIFVDHMETGEKYCFVEADIPIHTEPTIEGKVE